MLATQVNAPIASLRRAGSFGFDKGLVFPDKLIHLSKTLVSNARGSPRSALIPSPRAALKLLMPHTRDCQREQMPRGCPEVGVGGDWHRWN